MTRTLTRMAAIGGAALLLLSAGVATAAAQQTSAEGDRQFSLTPTGYLQLDVRGYPGWDEATGTGDLPRSTLEVRRLRAGLEGAWKRWSWEVTVDPLDEDGTFVKDAYLETRLPHNLQLRAGQFKLPSSREYLVSARELDFLERSAASSSIAAGRDVGVMLIGRAGKVVRYRGGVFAGDGAGRDGRSGLTAAGRIVWEPVRGLEIGGVVTEGRVDAVDTAPENGLDGRAPSGYRFFDEIYVHGRRLRVGADVEWTRGPWQVVAEALRAREDRRAQGLEYEDLPALAGNGWTASVVRRFGVRPNAPDRQWHIGVRLERLEFDDVGAETNADSMRSRATNVRARVVEALTAGAAWNATPWMRLLGNAGLERYTEIRSAPDPGTRNYLTIGLRLQLQLP